MKAKEEFIHKQEESAVQTKAGSKRYEKGLETVDPQHNINSDEGGNRHSPLEIGTGMTAMLFSALLRSQLRMWLVLGVSIHKNAGQEEKSCRNKWRSGKRDLRGEVKRTQGCLAREQAG